MDSINYESLAKRLVERFRSLFDAEVCTLWRRVEDAGQDVLVLSASAGFERKPGEEVPTYRLNWNAASNAEIDGVTAWIAIKNTVCLANSYPELKENPSAPWHGTHRGKWDNLTHMGGDATQNFSSLRSQAWLP